MKPEAANFNLTSDREVPCARSLYFLRAICLKQRCARREADRARDRSLITTETEASAKNYL